jgi:MOSC domain-containing protein YiiM
MKVVTINVGRPRDVEWRGESVRTSIFKTPVSGRVRVSRLNLEGDAQSDLSVHGGAEKAVYAYPSEHYAWWREELPELELPWGVFGENLTIAGLLEDAVHIGDHLRSGTAEFIVTQPRMPCFKLGIRFGRPDIVKRFQQSGRSGFYLAVVREGEIAAGDALEWIRPDTPGISVAHIARLYTSQSAHPDEFRRASELASLPGEWRDHFRNRWRSSDAESR